MIIICSFFFFVVFCKPLNCNLLHNGKDRESQADLLKCFLMGQGPGGSQMGRDNGSFITSAAGQTHKFSAYEHVITDAFLTLPVNDQTCIFKLRKKTTYHAHYLLMCTLLTRKFFLCNS